MAADSGDPDATWAAPPVEAEAARALATDGAAPYRTVAPGDRLGRYEVQAAIGEGGMATVFRARDPELRRDVAIKVLFPHLSRRREIVQRFQREARAAARLRHPAILQTFDVGGGEGGEPPYIVMELVQGRSLQEHQIERGPLLAELVACAGVVVAEALAVAHQAGVIHRDLKPANLLVTDDGRLLLADFGVARVELDESLATRTGAVLGTPAYMSPEQATGEDVDARSDVYSLGATLYHLATGAPPYAGSAMKVMSQLATPGALVTPQQRRAAVGRPLSNAILELMAHEPERRPASAREAAAALRPLTAGLAAGEAAVNPADELGAYFRDPDAYLAAAQPRVVTSLVERGRGARGAGKLAAAIAHADRASALAPDDEAVRALVRDVTSQQTSGRRWKVAAALMVPIAAAAALVIALRAGEPSPGERGEGGEGRGAATETTTIAETAELKVAVDAATQTRDAPHVAAIDIVPPPVSPGTRAGNGVTRAQNPAPRSPGSRSASSRGAAVASLSSPPSPGPTESPAPPSPLPIDPAPAKSSAVFAMDAWCELSIDGNSYGRADRNRPIALSVGKHSAECTQGPGLGTWRGEFDVPPASDAPLRVTGELRMEVAVTVDVTGTSVTLDGKPLANLQRLAVRNGRHHVIVRAGERELTSGWVSIPRVARCTLRDQPVLDCYP